MKVVRKCITVSMGLVDIRTVTDYLMENGSWLITDPEKLIASDIHTALMGMCLEQKGESVSVKLQDMPSLEEVAGFVGNKEPFALMSGKDGMDSELAAAWSPGYNILRLDYSYGQSSKIIQYFVQNIPDEKLCFVPVEIFYSPKEGINTVQRMRTRLFGPDEEAEAKRAMAAIQADLWGKDTIYGSAAEMFICNIDALKASSWYEDNLKAFQLREKHPEVEGYRVLATEDILYLEEQIQNAQAAM